MIAAASQPAAAAARRTNINSPLANSLTNLIGEYQSAFFPTWHIECAPLWLGTGELTHISWSFNERLQR
jgi:hypothetical protein